MVIVRQNSPKPYISSTAAELAAYELNHAETNTHCHGGASIRHTECNCGKTEKRMDVPPPVELVKIHRLKVVSNPEFWAQFAEQYWEKKPLVLKKPFAARLMSSREIFQALANAGSTEREDWGFRFYVEQALQEAEVAKHLPALSDGLLSGYAERVTLKLKGRQFAFVVDHYHKHDVQTWLRLREFLRGLYRVVGVPVCP